MLSFANARRIASINHNGAKTVGKMHKEESDLMMELTWDNDIQSRVCYIYDYFHDNQKDKKSHMTYENTTKTRIDAKFITKTSQSVDKDQVEYYVQFKPSQKTEFTAGDELYYFERDYRNRYGNNDFIGMYIDIPDDNDVYRKWIIVKKEIANQFVKYLVLPINYELMWIEISGKERIKRKMWCVLRSQNSYNSGLWTDRHITATENQKKCILPLNTMSESISYKKPNNENLRVIVSALVKKPQAWQISKVENTNEIGIQFLTLYQDSFNPHTDYVNLETKEMYADYYSQSTEPISDTDTIVKDCKSAEILASTNTIKIGGSYKLLSIVVKDENGNDITDNYCDAILEWSCGIKYDDELEESKRTWLDVKEFNKIKLKFSNDRSYLGKTLEVRCKIIMGDEILNSTTEFNLIV